jgi:hypothetical protein
MRIRDKRDELQGHEEVFSISQIEAKQLLNLLEKEYISPEFHPEVISMVRRLYDFLERQ